jgi:hypothetical protein
MNVSDVNACPNRRNMWSDCGRGGISEQECLAKGCCWDPKSRSAWCYHKGRLEVPKLSWFYKIWDVLRATWANNHGALLLTHPSMSEWYEWPFMLHRSVPFGDTHAGGRLKAFGNPGIYYPVAFTIAVVTLGLVLSSVVVMGKLLISLRKVGVGGLFNAERLLWYVRTVKARWNGEGLTFRVCAAVNGIGGGGFINPFITH